MDQDDFKRSMVEWVSIKKQLASVRKDVSVLNKREKELRVTIQTFMKKNEIDACNAPGARVTYASRKTKGAFNRSVVREGLLQYFSGSEETVDRVMEIIESCVTPGHKDSVSIRINKSENDVE